MPNHFNWCFEPGGRRSQSIHPVAADGLRAAGARFKAFPIQQVEHLLPVRRSMERNPWRSVWLLGLKTGSGRVCGVEGEVSDACLPMHEPPVPLPRVKEPMTDAELERLHQCVKPGACFGREPLYLGAACTRVGNAIR